MPVDASAKGKQYPPFEYEVGKEKIREYALASTGTRPPLSVLRFGAAV